MTVLLAFLCAAAAAYQVIAILACLYQMRRRNPFGPEIPAVSILKPVYGAAPGFADAVRSHLRLDAPRYEVLFGVHSHDDPAAAVLRDLGQPMLVSAPRTPNRKVGTLIDLEREARYPVLLVNDGDIQVGPDYLRHVAAPLADARIGLVTCLYRARGGSFPARMEALGIATDFAPSALVAPLVGVNEFGLGSTLCFRREDLRRIGGFEAITDYIADDYRLGLRLSRAGLKVYLSQYVVETDLGTGSWADVWRHQVRWARTIRASRGGGYAGLPVTNATVWAMAAAAAGWPVAAVGLMALRLTSGLLAGVGVLRDPLTRRLWWLMPVRDLFGLAIWAAGLFGNTVVWGGRRLKLGANGRIVA